MDVVIMAAGKGKRLMPLTADRPKAMVTINGKPIIYWLLNEIKKTIINKIYIIIGYREGILKNYIKYNFEDMDITFIHQKEQTGTSDAIYLAAEHINKDFIVLSGDIVYSALEINDLIKQSNSLLFTSEDKKLYEYGTLDMKEDAFSNIWNIGFINEKSSRPTSNYINCGAYHFTPEVFKYIIKTDYDNRFSEKIITNTINLMIDDGISFKGVFISKLLEISYPDDIEKVELELSKRGIG